ncbi:MAG: isoprenylcysteine carboxylmethyltransferase family protein [Acidobacteriota bacterium]
MRAVGEALLQRIRVPAGFAAAALYFYFARPTLTSLLLGGGLALVGLVTRAWASGHLRKDSQLAVEGPYALTRNPLYLGSFVIGLGFALASGRPQIVVVFMVAFSVLYGPAMNRESSHLLELFGQSYQRYCENVPVFFPKLRLPLLGGFSFRLYWRNREYQALLGYLAALAVLVLKIRYR